MTLLAIIQPETSVVIAAFWLTAIFILKIGTYAMHIVLFITWKLFSMLKELIFEQG
jgi:hypothetical protein